MLTRGGLRRPRAGGPEVAGPVSLAQLRLRCGRGRPWRGLGGWESHRHLPGGRPDSLKVLVTRVQKRVGTCPVPPEVLSRGQCGAASLRQDVRVPQAGGGGHRWTTRRLGTGTGHHVVGCTVRVRPRPLSGDCGRVPGGQGCILTAPHFGFPATRVRAGPVPSEIQDWGEGGCIPAHRPSLCPHWPAGAGGRPGWGRPWGPAAVGGPG